MKHPIVIANLLGVDGKQTTISSDLCLQISLKERELRLLEYNAEAQAEQGKTTQRKL